MTARPPRALGVAALTALSVVLSDAARVLDATAGQAARVGAASAALYLLGSAASRYLRPAPVPPLVAVFRSRRRPARDKSNPFSQRSS